MTFNDSRIIRRRNVCNDKVRVLVFRTQHAHCRIRGEELPGLNPTSAFSFHWPNSAAARSAKLAAAAVSWVASAPETPPAAALYDKRYSSCKTV
jgi:hypothetical protein